MQIRACVVMAAVLAVLSFGVTEATAQDDLIMALTKEVGVTADQARGGAGSVFSLAKTKLSPGDFAQVSKAVPGMDGLLKAAPALGGSSALGSLGAMAALAPAFQKLGISPALAAKFIPVITQFVSSKGGADVAKLLAAALK